MSDGMAIFGLWIRSSRRYRWSGADSRSNSSGFPQMMRRRMWDFAKEMQNGIHGRTCPIVLILRRRIKFEGWHPAARARRRPRLAGSRGAIPRLWRWRLCRDAPQAGGL